MRSRRVAPDRKTVTRLFVAVLALQSVFDLQAQELVTDRPDQTESAVTVPEGLWQIETGWTLSRKDGEEGQELETIDLLGTLVRVGVSESWELRFGWEGFVRESLTGDGASTEIEGAGDGELGAKVHLRAEGKTAPEIALLFGTSLPIGRDGLSSDRFDPSFRLSFSHTLSERLSLGYNLGMEWESAATDTGGSATVRRGIFTVALGASLSERSGVFIELYGDLWTSDDSATAQSIDGGFTWLLTETLQLDVAGGIGLSDAADDWFIGLGVSLRIPS